MDKNIPPREGTYFNKKLDEKFHRWQIPIVRRAYMVKVKKPVLTGPTPMRVSTKTVPKHNQFDAKRSSCTLDSGMAVGNTYIRTCQYYISFKKCMELMWLMRTGCLNIISLLEPLCLSSPSTCSEANLSERIRSDQYKNQDKDNCHER